MPPVQIRNANVSAIAQPPQQWKSFHFNLKNFKNDQNLSPFLSKNFPSLLYSKYFKLPEDNGWNNGRALLISQGILSISNGLSAHLTLSDLKETQNLPSLKQFS